MTPTPYRGKRNEPAYVHYVAQEIADLKEMSYEQLTKQTFNNACTLFGLEDKRRLINRMKLGRIMQQQQHQDYYYQELS